MIYLLAWRQGSFSEQFDIDIEWFHWFHMIVTIYTSIRRQQNRLVFHSLQISFKMIVKTTENFEQKHPSSILLDNDVKKAEKQIEWKLQANPVFPFIRLFSSHNFDDSFSVATKEFHTECEYIYSIEGDIGMIVSLSLVTSHLFPPRKFIWVYLPSHAYDFSPQSIHHTLKIAQVRRNAGTSRQTHQSKIGERVREKMNETNSFPIANHHYFDWLSNHESHHSLTPSRTNYFPCLIFSFHAMIFLYFEEVAIIPFPFIDLGTT